MDSIASKNEKLEVNNAVKSKLINKDFKEKNEFNISITKINQDNRANENKNIHDNNENENITNKNNEKEKLNKNTNINEDSNNNENENSSENKGDISGIIVGVENNEKEQEGKMENEILSNQGFDDNNLIQDLNDNLNSEEEFTATMELTQPLSNSVNNEKANDTNYNDNIDKANKFIYTETKSQIINVNNIKDKDFKIFKESQNTTQTNIFDELPIHDETLHTEIMDIDLSLPVNNKITEIKGNDLEVNKNEDNNNDAKLFMKNKSLKGLLKETNYNNNGNDNESNLSKTLDMGNEEKGNHNNLKSLLNNNNKNSSENEQLINNKGVNVQSGLLVYKNNEEQNINNSNNNKDNLSEINKKQIFEKSDILTESNNKENKIEKEETINSKNDNFTSKSSLNKSNNSSRKESKQFLFSSQQSNLSTLTTDDRINDSYNDYNTYINDIVNLIPDSPETNGTQSEYVLSQQSDTGTFNDMNKDGSSKINKIQQLLKNSSNPINQIQNKENKNINYQMEKENNERIEKLKVFENIDKDFENEDESYNFMTSYGKDRRKIIENSANFILKNNINEIENLNKNDDSLTNNMLTNYYTNENNQKRNSIIEKKNNNSDYINRRISELRRISNIGINKENNSNLSETETNDENEQTMDITVGVGTILSANNVAFNNDTSNIIHNSNKNIKKSIGNSNNLNEINTKTGINKNDNNVFIQPEAKYSHSEINNFNGEDNNNSNNNNNDNNNSNNNASNNKSQDLMLMRNQSQNSVINEYINILTPIKNSIVKRMANKQIRNNINQKENNTDIINEYRRNSMRMSLLTKNTNKIEDSLFQNHTLDERDIERNDSIKLSSTIDVLPITSPYKRYSILSTRATPSNKRHSSSYSIFNEIMQTPRKLREKKRQQDLLSDSINSYNSITLNKPINTYDESNLANTMEINSPTNFLGNEEIGNEENLLNEELSILGGDISITEDNLDEKSVTLSRYLQLIGIQFKNSFDKKIEREHQNIEINNNMLTEVEKLKAISVYLQELEGLKYECVDIEKSIKECQNSLNNFDKEFLKKLPTCFKDYSNAVDDQRRDLQQKLKTTQEYSRLKAKQAWYRWRTSMCNEMIKKYKKSIELFKMDMEKINNFSSEITKYVPSMKLYYNQLMDVINLNKSQEVFSESFEERMSLLEKKTLEQKQYILSLKSDTLSYEKDKENSLKKIEELKNTIEQLNNIIEQSDERIRQLESTIFTKEALQKSKKEYNLVVSVSNWKIKSLSPDLISYTYDDILQVSFNRRNQTNLIYDVNINFINLKKSKFRINIEKFNPIIKGIQNKISVCKNDKNIRKTLDEVSFYWNRLKKLFQDIELVLQTNIVEIYTADSDDIESKEIPLSMQSNTTIVRIVFFDGKQKFRYFVDFFINCNCAYPYGKLNWRFVYKYGNVKYELVKQIINDTPKGKRRLEEICKNLRTIQI